MILSVIFIVQVSMNFNASVYGNVVTPLSEHFHISLQAARVGQMTFLIAYAFGSELWAPWSEELGRKLILQLSLFFVNSESCDNLSLFITLTMFVSLGHSMCCCTKLWYHCCLSFPWWFE